MTRWATWASWASEDGTWTTRGGDDGCQRRGAWYETDIRKAETDARAAPLTCKLVADLPPRGRCLKSSWKGRNVVVVVVYFASGGRVQAAWARTGYRDEDRARYLGESYVKLGRADSEAGSVRRLSDRCGDAVGGDSGGPSPLIAKLLEPQHNSRHPRVLQGQRAPRKLDGGGGGRSGKAALVAVLRQFRGRVDEHERGGKGSSGTDGWTGGTGTDRMNRVRVRRCVIPPLGQGAVVVPLSLLPWHDYLRVRVTVCNTAKRPQGHVLMGVVAWGGIIIASSLDNNPKKKKDKGKGVAGRRCAVAKASSTWGRGQAVWAMTAARGGWGVVGTGKKEPGRARRFETVNGGSDSAHAPRIRHSPCHAVVGSSSSALLLMLLLCLPSSRRGGSLWCHLLQPWKRACQRAPDRRRAVGLVSKDIMLTMQNVRDLRPRDGAIRGALPAATSLAPFIEIRHACAAIPAGRALHRLEHTQAHISSCSTAIHFRPHAASGPMLHPTRTTTPRCIQKSRQDPDLPVPSATCISRIRHGRRTVAVAVLQAHPTRNSLGRLASSHCRILLYRRSRV
ncbi:hypothetical protein Purlil1_2701 [Purpureocillium lilacinum]|uniref:Uncharacterized protein n=1 Tax=Purpureocillium lilacinum TaxID=33203 RepID=A0ABR0C9Z9_PURLI|nr:hypothetical protein Purlil1_2701 [Purpureocillium lilacinum]